MNRRTHEVGFTVLLVIAALMIIMIALVLLAQIDVLYTGFYYRAVG